MPALSVIVPCHDRLELVRPVLRGLVAQLAGLDAELLLVDDGSQPPASSLLAALGAPPGLRVIRHEHCLGVSAARNSGIEAATGEILLFCDSDVRPAPGMVADHLAFHRARPDSGATQLGRLDWGIDAGLLGALLGARGNPRLRAHTGSVGWTEWFMDNWSAKRALFAPREHRFDPEFRRWGWEDLDLAWRLQRAGATSTLCDGARGLHLKPIEIDAMLHNFRSSVPNLLRLARRADDPTVDQWLGLGVGDASVLATCERALRDAWTRCLELHERSGDLVAAAGPLAHELAIAVSDALFRVGIGRGLREAVGTEELASLGAGPPADRERVIDMGALLAAVSAIAARVDPGTAPRLGQPISELAGSLPGVERALAARVRTEWRRLRRRTASGPAGAPP